MYDNIGQPGGPVKLPAPTRPGGASAPRPVLTATETCCIVRMDRFSTHPSRRDRQRFVEGGSSAIPEVAMPEYTTTLLIRGEECDYDPEGHMARIPCENCGHVNEVEVWTDDAGAADFSGFACENCGHWNGSG